MADGAAGKEALVALRAVADRAGAGRQAYQVLRYVWSHPANRRRRLRGVARATVFQLRGRVGQRTLTAIGRHGRMWAQLHYTAASKVLYANPPDWNEMQAWRRILRRGDLFLDVGSNVGSYALWAADAGAEVIAIEPSPDAATKLRENVGLNAFPITVLQCGLAAEPGRMTLTRGQDSNNHLMLDPVAVGDEIEVDTLDRVLGGRYAAGVKIDVEGAERLVLEGAGRALAEHRIGVLQLEWNELSERVLGDSRAPVAELLGRHGYVLRRPDPRGVLRETHVADTRGEDVFAVRPGHPALHT
jgi:FkbM family methyltransferase